MLSLPIYAADLTMPNEILGGVFDWLGSWIAVGGGMVFFASLIGFGIAHFTESSQGKSGAITGMIGGGIVIAAGMSAQFFLTLGQ